MQLFDPTYNLTVDIPAMHKLGMAPVPRHVYGARTEESAYGGPYSQVSLDVSYPLF